MIECCISSRIGNIYIFLLRLTYGFFFTVIYSRKNTFREINGSHQKRAISYHSFTILKLVKARMRKSQARPFFSPRKKKESVVMIIIIVKIAKNGNNCSAEVSVNVYVGGCTSHDLALHPFRRTTRLALTTKDPVLSRHCKRCRHCTLSAMQNICVMRVKSGVGSRGGGVGGCTLGERL